MKDDITDGPALSLILDEAGHSLVASLEYDSRFPSINAVWLRNRITAAGHEALRIRPDAIRGLIAQYNAGRNVAPSVIADVVDGTVDILVSADGLSATMSIFPPRGGKPVSRTMLLEALEARGVIEGILVAEINRAINSGEARELVIARGRAPVAGEDGRLECLLPDTRDRVPSIRPTGRTDYRDLGDIMVVHAGDALMRRHPPTPGSEGLSVQGRPIAPRAGRAVRFAAGLRGTAISPDDPDLLIAATDGQPVRVRGGMVVEPILTLKTVNMATGNINFDGNVKVLGDVTAGMTVRATGDIEIGGVVEPALLDAGGSIVVKGGVMGGIGGKTAAKDAGTHGIRCGGSFSAIYAQQARIDAGDSIFIDDVAMQCELSAANHIRVGNHRRGHIIGGTARASLSIHARVIGSSSRTRTELVIGTGPALAQAMQQKLEARDQKENQLLEVGKLLTLSDRNPGRVPEDVVTRAEQTAATLAAEIETLRGEEADLRHLLELTQQARVEVEREMHEGVTITLGEHKLRIPHELGACTVRLADQGLGIFPLT